MNEKNFVDIFNKIVSKNQIKYSKLEAGFITSEYEEHVYYREENPLEETYWTIKEIFENTKDPYYNVRDRHETDGLFVKLYEKFYKI